ncbi:exopolysaccharide production protein [Leifsonia sp. ZF2019]|uniref:O-antigen ligase family protein n=1 Tax=Leifsonia sp. ZF2019 TaxID=2781978 RepID=UPI001CBD1EE7|nr:exopolysaccharide production protein [Leifsonia sp. ZF2019]UAJ80573.1 exopolysaccharide production protein [Leifsonia sp. ZF2019]
MAEPRTPRVPAAVTEFLGSARFNSALALVAVGTAFSTHAIRALIGWPGLIGVLGGLAVLAAISFVAQWKLIEWHGLLPVSALLFVGWCALSLLWSQYQWATLAGVIYQLLFAFLAVYIALVRDAIQIVRVVGDALRFLLTVSLALEVLSGLLIDLPITFLGIQGNIAVGGPIQGLFGTRNQLSIVALIAFVTFLVELRTRSVRPPRAAFSITLAVLCILLAHSPVIAAVSLVVGLATFALYLMRKVPVHQRTFVQWGLAILTVAALVLAYLYRTRVIDLLNARADFQVRYRLWIQIWELIPVQQSVGWGWVGAWPTELYPFTAIQSATGVYHSDGLNAYLDVYLQVGIIGLLLFVALIALAFVRSWLLASNRRSVVYAWAPLVLVALLVTSVFESSILVEAGWLLLIVCTVKASQGMSWRLRLPRRDAA